MDKHKKIFFSFFFGHTNTDTEGANIFWSKWAESERERERE